MATAPETRPQRTNRTLSGVKKKAQEMRQIASYALRPTPSAAQHAWYPPHSRGDLCLTCWCPAVGRWQLSIARRGQPPSDRELAIFIRDFGVPPAACAPARRQTPIVTKAGAFWHVVRFAWTSQEELDAVTKLGREP